MIEARKKRRRKRGRQRKRYRRMSHKRRAASTTLPISKDEQRWLHRLAFHIGTRAGRKVPLREVVCLALHQLEQHIDKLDYQALSTKGPKLDDEE